MRSGGEEAIGVLPGQYWDKETNLHYNYFRDYDPSIGRYIQSDPIGLEAGQFSTYSYVGSDPLRLADPQGLATTKVDGNKVQVHKNDVDPWPSKPHGHIYDKNQVVDKDGNIYDKSTKQKVGAFSKKALAKWAEFLKKLEGPLCVPLMTLDIVESYCQQYPLDPACAVLSPTNTNSSGICAGIPGCT